MFQMEEQQFLTLDFGTTALKVGVFKAKRVKGSALPHLTIYTKTFGYEIGDTSMVLPQSKKDISSYAPVLVSFLATYQRSILHLIDNGYQLSNFNSITVFSCAPSVVLVDKDRAPLCDLFLSSHFVPSRRGVVGYYEAHAEALLNSFLLESSSYRESLINDDNIFVAFSDYIGYLLTGNLFFSCANKLLQPYFSTNTVGYPFPPFCELGHRIGSTKETKSPLFKDTKIVLYSGGADYIADMLGAAFFSQAEGLLRCGSQEGLNLYTSDYEFAKQAKGVGFSLMPHPFAKGYVISKIIKPFLAKDESYLKEVSLQLLSLFKIRKDVKTILLCGGQADVESANKIRKELLDAKITVSGWGSYCGVAGACALLLYKNGFFSSLMEASLFISTYLQKG